MKGDIVFKRGEFQELSFLNLKKQELTFTEFSSGNRSSVEKVATLKSDSIPLHMPHPTQEERNCVQSIVSHTFNEFENTSVKEKLYTYALQNESSKATYSNKPVFFLKKEDSLVATDNNYYSRAAENLLNPYNAEDKKFIQTHSDAMNYEYEKEQIDEKIQKQFPDLFKKIVPERFIPVKAQILEKSQKDIRSTDPSITRERINKAKASRRTYTRAMKNVIKNGWDSFKKFEKYGIFDIIGKTIATDEKGNITDDGWIQMAQAMRIYRDKHFETFRLAFVNKTGTIQDQVNLCSYMPNRVVIHFDSFIEDIIEYAEQSNTSIVAVHNHPSGNTEKSLGDRRVTDELKKKLIDSKGQSLFQGHIILNHDTFGLYQASNDDWKKVDSGVTGIDPLMKQRIPNFASQEMLSNKDLKEIAERINSNEKWNCTDWIPVLFVNSSSNIRSIRYYSKEILENSILENSKKIKEMFQTVGKTTGSISAFPVVPDELSNNKDFLSIIKAHTRNGCFSDFYMDGKTAGDYGLDKYLKKIFEDVTRDELFKKTTFDTTFTSPSIESKLEKEMLHIADIAVSQNPHTPSVTQKSIREKIAVNIPCHNPLTGQIYTQEGVKKHQEQSQNDDKRYLQSKEIAKLGMTIKEGVKPVVNTYNKTSESGQRIEMLFNGKDIHGMPPPKTILDKVYIVSTKILGSEKSESKKTMREKDDGGLER